MRTARREHGGLQQWWGKHAKFAGAEFRVPKHGGALKRGGGPKLKIGFSIALRDQWLTTLETAAKKKAEENGVDFTVYDAESDVQKQLSHITTMATQNFDVMIVNLVNTDNSSEVISAAGISIVFVNRLPNQENLVENKIVYVGSDENTSGKLQGEYLAKYFKEQGKQRSITRC